MDKIRKKMYACCAIAILLLVAACLLPGMARNVCTAAGIVVLLYFAYIWKTRWVCPHCGQHLGRDVVNTRYCKKCKRPLD